MDHDSPIDLKAGATTTDFITRKYGDQFSAWGVNPNNGQCFGIEHVNYIEQLREAAPEGYRMWTHSILVWDDAKKVQDLADNVNLTFTLLGDVPESYMVQISED